MWKSWSYDNMPGLSQASGFRINDDELKTVKIEYATFSITLQHYIDEVNEVMFAKLRRLLDEEIPLHEIPERMKALNDKPSWLTNFNYENFYYL